MTHRIHVWYIYIYANIGGILMGFMLPYIPYMEHMGDIPMIFPSSPHPSRGCQAGVPGGSSELREVLQQRVTRLAEELMKHDVELQEWFMVVYGIYMDL